MIDLNKTPEVSLNSEFPNTINGFLPFQVRGFNFLKDLDAGIMLMDTGTGKTHLSAGLLKYHLKKDTFDIAIVVCKAHNKTNFQRELREKADIEAIILDGPLERRKEVYKELNIVSHPLVIITNYEKFRIDFKDYWKPLFRKRLLIFYDEMPTKLKNRGTMLYRRLRYLLYKKKLGDLNPKSLRQYMLTATPIENSPEDFFSCCRLLDPKLLGSVIDFHNEYVSYYNDLTGEPQVWRNLDKLGKKVAPITYKIAKSDPQIANQFPRVREEHIYVDWHPDDLEIYQKLSKKSKEIFDEDGFNSILPLISLMQMMCDMPSSINLSAHKYTLWEQEFLEGNMKSKSGSSYAQRFISFVGELYDDKHTKIEALRELILERHPNEKILIFSVFNNMVLPALSNVLDEWGQSHVIYTGTTTQKQNAQDKFKSDDDIRIFLSSDAGSDSINLQEASVVIHYDIPYKNATYIQRQNRAHRITSTHNAVNFYTLLMDASIDTRKQEIIKKKEKYQIDIFSSNQVDALTRQDLQYLLFGPLDG